MLGIPFRGFEDYIEKAGIKAHETGGYEVVEKVEDRFVPEYMDNEIIIGDDIVLLSKKKIEFDNQILALLVVGCLTDRGSNIGAFTDNHEMDITLDTVIPLMRRVREELLSMPESAKKIQKEMSDWEPSETRDYVVGWLIMRYNLCLDDVLFPRLRNAFYKALAETYPKINDMFKELSQKAKEEKKRKKTNSTKLNKGKAKGKIPKKGLPVKKENRGADNAIAILTTEALIIALRYKNYFSYIGKPLKDNTPEAIGFLNVLMGRDSFVQKVFWEESEKVTNSIYEIIQKASLDFDDEIGPRFKFKACDIDFNIPVYIDGVNDTGKYPIYVIMSCQKTDATDLTYPKSKDDIPFSVDFDIKERMNQSGVKPYSPNKKEQILIPIAKRIMKAGDVRGFTPEYIGYRMTDNGLEDFNQIH